MGRVRIEMPATFSFRTMLPIRITDINYGGHLGNDAVLSLVHEARMQFLGNAGFTELDTGGVSLIMADAAIVFRGEGFYGDIITAEVQAGEFARSGFEIYYRLSRQDGKLVAEIKTGMVCFDYNERKIVALPEVVKEKLK